jgi:hypothetical protein
MPTGTALGCVQCPPTRMLSVSTMTAQRQERNGDRFGTGFRPRIALIALMASLAAQACPDFAARAATTERVVVNRFTGLAIEGFDPVAYFVDARALVGLPEFEASEAGAVWRFRNEGNRASFAAHPDIYGPQFGGYDPTDLARGVTVAGNPRFWSISGQRLYLFGREESRDAFAADPARFLPEANARWPALEQGLAQ